MGQPDYSVPQGKERWVMVYLSTSKLRAQASMQHQVKRAQAEWEKQCWQLSHRCLACETDAQMAMEREKKGCPAWRDIQDERVFHAPHTSRGRPGKEDSPRKEAWHIVAMVMIHQERIEQETFRRA